MTESLPRPLQISLFHLPSCNLIALRPLAFIPLHCWAVTWCWQTERHFWLYVRVHVLQNNPMYRCLPIDQLFLLLLPSQILLYNISQSSDNIRLDNWIRSGMCVSCFYSESDDIWGLGVTRCFHWRSHWFLMWLILWKPPFHPGWEEERAEVCASLVATCLDLA